MASITYGWNLETVLQALGISRDFTKIDFRFNNQHRDELRRSIELLQPRIRGYENLHIWLMCLQDSEVNLRESKMVGISSMIGDSELAGIYGGLNLDVGILYFIGIFSINYMRRALQLLMFLTGSIAMGRVLFSIIPSTPPLVNTFFLFEIVTFVICLLVLILFKPLKKSA